MLTAQVFNWTGHVLLAPRTQLSRALKRSEASHTGVYILLGDKNGAPHAYIGEAEDIGTRIRSHDSKKDWWTSAVFVTSAKNDLNKAHARYLEARLVEEATATSRSRLENGNTPGGARLSEAEEADMEGFLQYLLMVLPAIRVDLFLSHKRPNAANTPSETTTPIPRFELKTPKHGIIATARLQDGAFIAEADSAARAEWASKN
ncbi:GIY-YIG nuclease family protein [Yunchengibacter salinarum]|uniref:GIY-YIG nuclease family protein n=1 Tax=Yunchengibacter salinarum TaxID=3133399 RepID=UPI0035B57895